MLIGVWSATTNSRLEDYLLLRARASGRSGENRHLYPPSAERKFLSWLTPGDSFSRNVDCAALKTLYIEDLKRLKSGTWGTFSRRLNRRLSHWLYASIVRRLEQYCEEYGIRLEKKAPYKTSQYCRPCGIYDRRNRRGDRFKCVHCSYSAQANHPRTLWSSWG